MPESQPSWLDCSLKGPQGPPASLTDQLLTLGSRASLRFSVSAYLKTMCSVNLVLETPTTCSLNIKLKTTSHLAGVPTHAGHQLHTDAQPRGTCGAEV